MSIKEVISGGYCIGCGACQVSDPDSVKINFVEEGYYKAKINFATDLNSQVCPFSSDAKNETLLAESLYGNESLNYDERVGYFKSVYAGYVNDNYQRENSSSGGLTSWITEKLLLSREIDAVVHVGTSGSLFQYKVSRTVDEVREKNNKKSRYYPVTYSSIIDYLLSTNDRIVFIGIPCFIKSIRLLQDQGFLQNIKYTISLLCGHMKLSGFAESLAWQVGVKPKELQSVDFRVKVPGYPASSYFFEAVDMKGRSSLAKNSDLLGANWGMGFFRHKACDYCDDIAGEVADVTLGDAWLPKYTADYLGTNIVIVRNKFINELLCQGDDVTVEEVDVDTFFETQAGNYRNRRGGIIARTKNNEGWYPPKRIEICTKFAGDSRMSNIYIYRSKLSALTVRYFIIAKKINSFFVFKLLMMPALIKYNFLMAGVKGAIKSLRLFCSVKVKKSEFRQ